MQDRLLFVISPPRAGSTLLQRMLGSHSQIFTYAEPHLITPLAFLGYYDLVDKAPYDHIHAAQAMRTFVAGLPRGESDYLDALRAYADTLYDRMLAPSGKRYFLDKTPAYALVLPFLRQLYPQAHYIALTRHPLAVASSYAESFFDGDWRAAEAFNPVVKRYLPAIARLLRDPPEHFLHVGYEQLVHAPDAELERVFRFLNLAHEPHAVDYGAHYTPVRDGRGDPIGVDRAQKPVGTSLDKWVDELARSPEKLELARALVAALDVSDLRAWGFAAEALLAPVERVLAAGRAETQPAPKPWPNNFQLQRRVMLALKKDIRHRPHGRLIERVRYYCNVLLRE